MHTWLALSVGLNVVMAVISFGAFKVAAASSKLYGSLQGRIRDLSHKNALLLHQNAELEIELIQTKAVLSSPSSFRRLLTKGNIDSKTVALVRLATDGSSSNEAAVAAVQACKRIKKLMDGA